MLRVSKFGLGRPLACAAFVRIAMRDTRGHTARAAHWYEAGHVGGIRIVEADLWVHNQVGGQSPSEYYLDFMVERIGGRPEIARWSGLASAMRGQEPFLADDLVPATPESINKPVALGAPAFSCSTGEARHATDPAGDVADQLNGDGHVDAPWLDLRSVTISGISTQHPCVALTLSAPLRGPTVIDLTAGDFYSAGFAAGSGPRNQLSVGLAGPHNQGYGERGSTLYLRLDLGGESFRWNNLNVCVHAPYILEPLLDRVDEPNDLISNDGSNTCGPN